MFDFIEGILVFIVKVLHWCLETPMALCIIVPIIILVAIFKATDLEMGDVIYVYSIIYYYIKFIPVELYFQIMYKIACGKQKKSLLYYRKNRQFTKNEIILKHENTGKIMILKHNKVMKVIVRIAFIIDYVFTLGGYTNKVS